MRKKLSMLVTTRIHRAETVVVEVPRTTLLALLRKHLSLPAEAEVFVRVPGGADWSNTDLDIDDKDTPLVVRYTRTTQKRERSKS